ncbi:cilia- and flagella-associated protein 43 [Silurus meridionalis]|uniref:cilia- and flagella-associated protein 43 n=1 Tax=Silurus meridionalis TaxID=175797 RepID=UPI001EEBA1A7|nr:cilia- and flagella-associated protein 43 [Silurus meridionalis]XP_046727649.1 cilia- and flagella-associated protein 43 [Silurus meridionalis]
MDNSESLEVRWVQGFTSSQVAFLEEKTACYPCGNYITFFNVETQTRKVLQSPGHGIGVFTANGLRRTLAFSEQKRSPSIFVYSYPELSLICELKGIAELSYTALALSDTAPYLASCSSLPDYTITVWNLEKGSSICSNRLSEEDVTSLHFNPISWQQICCLNPKSLTVWNIEKFNDIHIMKPSVIDLPAIDGSAVERINNSYIPTGKLTYSGPQMPTSTIAGLIGDKADYVMRLKEVKPQLCPSAICWSVSSDLYVGTKEGFLLLVNTESLIVCILYNPHVKQSTPECSKSLVIQEGSFQSLALCSNGMLTTGSDGVLQIFRIKGNKVEVVENLALVEPVSSLCFSPDNETLLLTSDTGRIYKYNPGPKNEVIKVLDVLCGNFIAAAQLYTEDNLCVSVRESGELQLWSMEDGDCIASLFLQTKVTCLACCPKAQYVAVGAVTGHVLFVDLTRAQEPRLVHTVYLYHVPVEHLVFDQGANFLITGAFDSHIFFLDARPSKAFEIIGYTEVMGATVSLSTQYQQESEKVDVLVLCNTKRNNSTNTEQKEGNLLMLLSLSTQQILDTANCVDPLGLVREQAIQTSLYEIPHSFSSCVLGTKTIFGYCHQKKVLQKFQLPLCVDKLSSNGKVVELSPEKEVKGHSFGPALLDLSPNQSWLASVGRDGLLHIHDIITLEIYVQKQLHSWWLAGIRSVSFTPDSHTLITTGLRDGSLVCSRLSLKIAEATQSDLSVGNNFEDKISQENPILSDMADWVSNTDQVTIDTDKKESYDSLPSTTPSNSTWLDNKLNTFLQEESKQFTETRMGLKKSVEELRDTIKAMMQENEKLPEIEKLEQLEFNLDMEEQQRLHHEGEQEVSKVRKEIELENLARCYLHDILKKKYWDSMTVKEKAIKAFISEQEVVNFPMKERTAKELEELNSVEAIRKTDSSQDVLENIKEVTEHNKDEENKKHKEESSALTGSLSAQYEVSNPHLYSQFSLHTRDLKINQIILLKDVIYKIKTAFNAEFESVYKQKEQEINRIKDKNRRITEIMEKLELQEILWEPILTDSERPERALTVNDSEIEVEKYLTPEQKQREKEQSKEVEQKRHETKGDNIRGRALDDMMGGVLEVKKEDILRTEVTPPEFIDKPEFEWTEEERRIYKEHEKIVKELNEEQEKYKKTLEAEMKKLQASIKDATKAFDETLSKLYEKKVKSEMILYQEELKITNLYLTLLIEEEMLNREEELIYSLEKAQTVKNQIGKYLKNYREDVEPFREMYDNTIAEDKLLDSGFRKEFSDVPGHIVDQLYRLYKRRPRIQIMRTQTDKIGSFKESAVLNRVAAGGLSQIMKAMEELDAAQNMPEGLDPAVWVRFCLARRTKVESEQKVKMKALTLAEMQTFLQKRTDEDENAQMEIMNLTDNLNSLRKERSRFCLDVMVQILLKQGQVEVKTEDFTTDYSDSLLLQRSVVEELNNSIRTLGVQKLASMMECKDCHKGIIQQEWEHMRMSKQIEDLKSKARDIQMLHVSQELQEYLTETDHENRMTKKVSALEKTLTLQEKNFKKNIKSCRNLIKELNRQAEVKKENNAALDVELTNLQMTVQEIRNIYETSVMEKTQESEAKQRYQNILRRKNLADLAKAQEMDIAVLNAKLESKRMKTFPAFPQ